MANKEIQKFIRGLENLTQEALGVVERIKKRGAPNKKNNEELQLDIENIKVTKTYILEQANITKYPRTSLKRFSFTFFH